MDELKQLRQKIDALDDQILQLLSKRVQTCKAIGLAKKAQGLPIHDSSREQEVYQKIKTKATDLSLSSEQVEAVYREIVNMCSAVQE